jgi:tetratricopeptide (TPR) repeat protein
MHPTIDRSWGRYRVRLAAAHLAFGRRQDALRHANAAVRHLEHCTDASKEQIAAYDIVATCQRELGQLEAAAAARRSAVRILELTARGTNASTLALVQLGDLIRFQGSFDEAEEVLSRALADVPTAVDGDGASLRALVLNALGIVYKDTGRFDAAEAAYAEALDLISAKGGVDDSAVASLWHNIAGLALARGDAHRAEAAAARAVNIRERALGTRHHLVAQDLAIHGVAVLEQHRTVEAEQLFERALAIFRARHPADQYDVAVNISNLAICRLQRNDAAGAETLLRQGLDLKQRILGQDHPEIARQLNNLGVAVAAQHRLGEANQLHGKALSLARNALPAQHPLTHTCARNHTAGHPSS